MQYTKKIYLAFCLWMTTFASATASSPDDIPIEDYVIRSGDTITTVLYRLGIGTPGSAHRLYGKGGWVERMNQLNPSLDLSRIYPGETIKIPRLNQTADAPPKPAGDVFAGEATIGTIAAPEVTNAPESSAPPLQEVATAKAIEVSFFNRNATPEDKELFKNLEPTPPAYFGVRIGKSLSKPANGLLAKIVSYGLLAEIRGGTFEGLRLLYEITPQVTLTQPTHKEELRYDRLLLGWAFEWEAPGLFDLVHLTPRLGRYSVDARYPTATSNTVENLSIPEAPSLGLEIDAEFAKYFYVVRFWAASDIPIPTANNDYETTNTRAGIDAYVKGSGFTLFDRKVSQSFLIYTSYEELTIKGKKPLRKGDSFEMRIPVIGGGYTLNFN